MKLTPQEIDAILEACSAVRLAKLKGKEEQVKAKEFTVPLADG